MNQDELEKIFASHNIQGKILSTLNWLEITSGLIHKENEYFLYVIKDNNLIKFKLIKFSNFEKFDFQNGDFQFHYGCH